MVAQTNHELQAIDLINSCGERIHSKLSCVIDYKGFRVLAYADWNEENLKHVFDLRGEQPRVHDKISKVLQSIGNVLNFKPHSVMLKDDRRVTITVGSSVQVS